ncbi:MAG: excalibur calcium-binding domain-containing protein, partial [Rhodococcus sp. (in: high G+C Gram-positive bacteria)]
MTRKTMLVRAGLGGFVLAAAMATTPAVAAADPITDFLCNSGSAQFCPVPLPPAPLMAPAPRSAPAPSAFQYRNCTE